MEDPVCKLSLIGDANVGKSTMLVRYTSNTFSETPVTLIGDDFKEERLFINEKSMTLQIWDTAGQERFRAMTSSYYRGAHGILIVFSLTDRTSFDVIREKWMVQIQRYTMSTVCKVLVGNKADLTEQRVVTAEEAQALADELGVPYLETSAKTGQNITAAFRLVPERIADHVFQQQRAANLVRVRSSRSEENVDNKCKC